MSITSRIIRTQKDLDAIRHEEEGMFYIVIAGHIASFNGKYYMSLISAYEKMAQIAASQSEEIADNMVAGNKKGAIEAMEIALKTYVIPYRMH
jgi:hypothetical protein